MAGRHLVLLLAVASFSLHTASPAAAARPCHTFFISFAANPDPHGDGEVADHRAAALTTATVITVFRVRRLGPHLAHPHIHGHPRPNLHSIPANIQIHRPHELPEFPRAAAGQTAAVAAAGGFHERAKDILVVVVGILFGIGCGALTAASMYLVWSVLAGAAAASSPYDELYGDEDEEVSDSESPKKVGYVIIPGVEAHDGGKN